MKLHHPHHAGQKLATPWGELEVDKTGHVTVPAEAADFFQTTLKFKKASQKFKEEELLDNGQKIEHPHIDVPVDLNKMGADQIDQKLAHDEMEEELESEESEESSEGESRFAKKKKAKKS